MNISSQLKIIRPGCLVKLGGGEIPAVVLAASITAAAASEVCINGGEATAIELYRVVYEVAWWSGRERKTSWVEHNELAVNDSELRAVGFRDQSKAP